MIFRSKIRPDGWEHSGAAAQQGGQGGEAAGGDLGEPEEDEQGAPGSSQVRGNHETGRR